MGGLPLGKKIFGGDQLAHIQVRAEDKDSRISFCAGGNGLREEAIRFAAGLVQGEENARLMERNAALANKAKKFVEAPAEVREIHWEFGFGVNLGKRFHSGRQDRPDPSTSVGDLTRQSNILTGCNKIVRADLRAIRSWADVRLCAELTAFRRTLLVAEVWNSAQRVVEPVGEVGGADHQRKLDNLTFVVIFAQLLQRTSADRGSAAGDALGVKNRRFLLFVEE